MVNKEFVIEKVNLISRDLERLEVFEDKTFDELSKDFMGYAALKNFMMEIINRAIDINLHLVREWLDEKDDIPKTYREAFLILSEYGVLPKDFSEEIARSVGFRNAIVHDYNHLDQGIVYKSIDEAREQYTQYCRYIMKFVENV